MPHDSEAVILEFAVEQPGFGSEIYVLLVNLGMVSLFTGLGKQRAVRDQVIAASGGRALPVSPNWD